MSPMWSQWSGCVHPVTAGLACWDSGGCNRVVFITDSELTVGDEVVGHEVVGEYPAYHNWISCR
jgi:hypothetical protein